MVRPPPRRSFFFSPFLLAFRRTLVGAFVVSRSDFPFFVGVRGKLGVALTCVRPTLGAASPMKPRGSFSFACSYVILPAFSLSARGRGRWGRRAEGNGGARSGNARKSFAMLPPMQDWKRELNGGTMKDFVLKTDDRRGNLPLCFA